jgi:hypothetical protein
MLLNVKYPIQTKNVWDTGRPDSLHVVFLRLSREFWGSTLWQNTAASINILIHLTHSAT